MGRLAVCGEGGRGVDGLRPSREMCAVQSHYRGGHPSGSPCILPSVRIWYSRWGFSTGLWAWLWFSVGGGGCTLVAHSPFWGAVAGAVRLPLVGVYPDGFFVGVSTVGG